MVVMLTITRSKVHLMFPIVVDVVPTVICKENQYVLIVPNVNTPSGAGLLKGIKINKHRLVTLYVLSSLDV
jgi:hypothetical protein